MIWSARWKAGKHRLERATAAGGAVVPRRAYFVDVVIFAATFVAALVQRWTPSDIVWGLWTSSLIAGGIVISLPWVLGFLFPDFAQIPPEQRAFKYTVARLIILCVFLGTFAGAHGGYAAALESMVDAPGPSTQALVTRGALGDFIPAVRELLVLYWPVVAGTTLVMLQKFAHDVRTDDDDVILGPWKMMLRLHLLIFAFYVLHAAGVRTAFAAVALLVLYFPVDQALWRRLRRRGP